MCDRARENKPFYGGPDFEQTTRVSYLLTFTCIHNASSLGQLRNFLLIECSGQLRSEPFRKNELCIFLQYLILVGSTLASTTEEAESKDAVNK